MLSAYSAATAPLLYRAVHTLFTLKEGECMGACAMAPVLLVNNKKMHDYMTNEKLDALLKELK